MSDPVAPRANPVVIATWPFGLPAAKVAWQTIAGGGTALDAVESGVVSCEDDPSVNSVGYGGLPDAEGEVTLDASIMDHRGACGAVACLSRIRNPVRVARCVMERTPHVMLVGDGARRFAVSYGFHESDLLTEESARRYRAWREGLAAAPRVPEAHDTIGMLAIDMGGTLAGACSTSGTPFKLPGRVGDSPIIGAGLFVAGGVGAASATGVGEEAIKGCGSFAVVENLRRGLPPAEAISLVLEEIARRRGDANTHISFIALRADGASAGRSLRADTGFRYALVEANGGSLIDAAGIY